MEEDQHASYQSHNNKRKLKDLDESPAKKKGGKEEKPLPKNSSNLHSNSPSQQTFAFQSIGFISTCFKEKNGTPRQGTLCKSSKATLALDFGVPNPHHSLEGLSEYSHVWLLFIFHENKNKRVIQKVSPPRLEGEKVGVFATRSPHRPNPVGLSVAKLDKIVGSTLHLSGVDLIDGTPIIDVKPYIPDYDCVKDSVAPQWITAPPRTLLSAIKFTEEALTQLQSFLPKLQHYSSLEEVKKAIEEVLTQDPRSVYWKKKCVEETYGFCIDVLNVLCMFDDETKVVTVTGVEDWSQKYTKQQSTLA